MSFNDFENGPKTSMQQLGISDEDRRYKELVSNISQLIFEANTKVSRVSKFVDWLGTKRDSKILRGNLQSETQEIKEIFKETNDKLRAASNYGFNESNRRIMESFQQIQNLEASKSRKLVEIAKQNSSTIIDIDHQNYDDNENESNPLLGNQNQRENMEMIQTQMQIGNQATENEVLYNSTMIAERETEIEEIERGIVELNDIFKDLGTIVTDQQSLLDNIETNVNSVAMYTSGAADELHTANEYQKKSQKTKFMLIFFLVIVFIVLFTIGIS
ncbi:hypothetical protein BB559_002270 [Furculomyces boomerangus]|uniref:t-SNARE coiled-coil homology domain-containing protein n=2 Tax=Harpellales TaxID=61421 RepID=A0A2T9YWU4_9FUNG|nr:hypothetical protein BB559_002270 [Furculomyces boomerangus]PWA00915.1 hypothetical protein BB558_003017 [Smittium angustum]